MRSFLVAGGDIGQHRGGIGSADSDRADVGGGDPGHRVGEFGIRPRGEEERHGLRPCCLVDRLADAAQQVCFEAAVITQRSGERAGLTYPWRTWQLELRYRQQTVRAHRQQHGLRRVRDKRADPCAPFRVVAHAGIRHPPMVPCRLATPQLK
jgi:hypothetical protein